ncbi:hypothetical protein MN210_03755 [Psychrobacter raelei]|uniref:Uncharacterized protein n=1 Tax=Psychrobacter raelei TaxID=2565531 RepID=A0AAT9PFU7_9GAMM|nr:hypothetical protein [Psychrobacter sp. PraFG1]UNK05899.1 hypothetical protein MN210_03755 [Psychrobacter sp. PraFG1]
MSDSQPDYSQPEALEAYFKRKAEQESLAQAQAEQEAKELSAYDACVLKESAQVKELIAQAQAKDGHKD